MKVSDAAIEFYYLNYLYGFFVGGFVYSLLHTVFPDANLASFVANSPSARDLQRLYEVTWEVTTSEEPAECGDNDSKSKSLETATVVA